MGPRPRAAVEPAPDPVPDNYWSFMLALAYQCIHGTNYSLRPNSAECKHFISVMQQAGRAVGELCDKRDAAEPQFRMLTDGVALRGLKEVMASIGRHTSDEPTICPRVFSLGQLKAVESDSQQQADGTFQSEHLTYSGTRVLGPNGEHYKMNTQQHTSLSAVLYATVCVNETVYVVRLTVCERGQDHTFYGDDVLPSPRKERVMGLEIGRVVLDGVTQTEFDDLAILGMINYDFWPSQHYASGYLRRIMLREGNARAIAKKCHERLGVVHNFPDPPAAPSEDQAQADIDEEAYDEYDRSSRNGLQFKVMDGCHCVEVVKKSGNGQGNTEVTWQKLANFEFVANKHVYEFAQGGHCVSLEPVHVMEVHWHNPGPNHGAVLLHQSKDRCAAYLTLTLPKLF